ncbi:MAG: hypothetical protein ACWGMZ_07060 [Thermoguttaceae bacterium]
MKKAVLGLVVGSGLILLAAMVVAGRQSEAYGQFPQKALMPSAGCELLVVPIGSAEKGQMLAVIAPRERVLSVYQIEAVTGKIALKSVRNLIGDLQMTAYNNEAPMPQAIQNLLEQH